MEKVNKMKKEKERQVSQIIEFLRENLNTRNKETIHYPENRPERKMFSNP